MIIQRGHRHVYEKFGNLKSGRRTIRKDPEKAEECGFLCRKPVLLDFVPVPTLHDNAQLHRTSEESYKYTYEDNVKEQSLISKQTVSTFEIITTGTDVFNTGTDVFRLITSNDQS